MRSYLTAALLLTSLSACGDDVRPMGGDAGTDTVTLLDVPAVDVPGADNAVADVPVIPVSDGNDSFAEAEAIEVGAADPTAAVIQVPEDKDYFSFSATAGDWISITTTANPEDDPEMIDTVITLYDSAMVRVAENDDAAPRLSTDSEIIYLVPADGMFFIEVQEWSDWQDDPMLEGGATYTYDLRVGALNLDLPAVTADTEPNNTTEAATALTVTPNGEMGAFFGLTVGTFEDATDVDVYAITIPAGIVGISHDIMPSGATGYGSTTSLGNIWLTNAAGDIVARVDNSIAGAMGAAAFAELNPPVTEGVYHLWIEHGGTAGANDFYTTKNFMSPVGNPLEATDVAGMDMNGTLAMAEALTMEDREGDQVGFIGPMIGDGDVDYFSFDVIEGEVVSVFCGGESTGSGVRMLTAEIRGADDMVLPMGTGTEVGAEAIALREVAITTPGLHYLRLTKGSQDAEVVGNWARCGVVVGPPAPAMP